jgi:sec-independent protein translocase protein TatA
MFGGLLILGVLAVLLFGERLPEVARTVGKSLMEFKKMMSGFENEIRDAVKRS